MSRDCSPKIRLCSLKRGFPGDKTATHKPKAGGPYLGVKLTPQMGVHLACFLLGSLSGPQTAGSTLTVRRLE